MDLKELRQEIDAIDAQLTALFSQRMDVSSRVAAYKKEHGLPVLDASREEQKLQQLSSMVPEELSEDIKRLYRLIFELSRDRQQQLLADSRPPVCGLLGRTLRHSYSPQIHHLLGDYPYTLWEEEPEELDAFFAARAFDGLNVTIPYKKEAARRCDILSSAAERLGSVNTVIRQPDGTLFGDNTDVYGFQWLLHHSDISVFGKKALVFGSGGSSVTVCDVLRSEGASEIRVISRSGADNYENLSNHSDAQILINTTPLGMYPNNGISPVDLRQFPHCEGVVDLIYNPARTALLLQAEELGIPRVGGLGMLVAQARRSSELFTGREIPEQAIGQVIRSLACSMQNIVLVGAAAGRTASVGKLLAKKLGREFADCCGKAEILRDLGKRSGLVIAAESDRLPEEENVRALRQNGVICRLCEDSAENRTHTSGGICQPRWAQIVSVPAGGNASPEETAEHILEVLHEISHSERS